MKGLSPEQISMLLKEEARMKQWEYVDAFIVENESAIGDEFTPAEYREWMEEHFPDEAHKWSDQLAQHRQVPDQRAFTTECFRRAMRDGKLVETVGVGPNARYRIIETGQGVSSASVLRLHHREAEEMISRWENEMRFRGMPVAKRSKKAREAFALAAAEIKAVATILHKRLGFFDEEDES